MTDSRILYDYTNLQQAFKKRNLDLNDDWLRWVHAIMNTKVGEFTFENIPDTELTSEDIELALLFNSNLCFYDSPLVGFGLYLYAPCEQSHKYWKPKNVNLKTLRGAPIDTFVPYADIVRVRDNTMDIPPFITLTSWVRKIMTIEKTLEMTLIWARMPFVLTGSKEQVNQYKEIIKKVYNFEPFAIGEKGIVDSMKQYPVNLPLKPLETFELMSKYMDRTTEAMGIYSADKKAERLITAEVNAQNDYVDFVYSNMFNERKRSIEEANRRWGYNMGLRETFVENQKDNLEQERLKAELLEKTKAKYAKQVEEVKNQGKVEASAVTGIEATKIEVKNGGNPNDQ